MSLLLAAVIAAAPASPPEGADITFPAGDKTAVLRVVVTVDERSPELAWGAFLDKLFDYFDRDGDGFLSRDEAARVFPLPLPDGREAKMDFTRLDTDGDGKGSRSEFRTFYRAAGFAPVVAVIRPSSREHQRLGKALFAHLDRDGDGRLSRQELQNARTLLQRLDENEDELLTAAEILCVGTAAVDKTEASGLKAVPIARDSSSDAVLRLEVGKSGGSPKLESKPETFRVTETGNRTLGFRVPGGRVNVSTASGTNNSFRTAKGFYLAQFKDTLANKPSLRRAELEADPSLQVIAAMFDAADRDADGKLAPAELQAFLDLVELGVSAQVVIAIEDRGRNLFDLLDTNQDGVLDLAELNQALKPCEEATTLPLTPSTVPSQFRIVAAKGVAGSHFGPVPLPTTTSPKPSQMGVQARGPKWFQAMDRNGDGFVSQSEFIGSPELFRKLDTNGDGRISVEEAEAASR